MALLKLLTLPALILSLPAEMFKIFYIGYNNKNAIFLTYYSLLEYLFGRLTGSQPCNSVRQAKSYLCKRKMGKTEKLPQGAQLILILSGASLFCCLFPVCVIILHFTKDTERSPGWQYELFFFFFVSIHLGTTPHGHPVNHGNVVNRY